MSKGAIFSECGNFRYVLWRIWKDGAQARILRFIMLNPSTADAETDDSTVRRCIGFAQRLGFDGIKIYNLFAFRATKTADLRKAGFPIGEQNDTYILSGAKNAAACNTPVVIAWGAMQFPESVGSRTTHVIGLLARVGAPVHALHINQNGSPGHPLFLPYSCTLQEILNGKTKH